MLKKVVFTDNLKELQEEISKMSDKSKIVAKQIVKELSESGLKEMEDIYNNFDLKSNKPSKFYIEGTDTEKKVIMEGEQALYDEFGTGTEGELRPHPIKNEFDLNDYNTGKTIRRVNEKTHSNTSLPLGGLYWTYKDINGEIVYTQGTPAQQEGYISLTSTAKKAPKVIEKIMKEVVFND